MKTEQIKLMLVEDDPEYRHVIQFALRNDSELELISQFASAEQALSRLQNPSNRMQPDVVLLDLNLPGISGLDALPKLTRRIPESKVIVLTQSDNEADVLRAIKRGATGYLLKSASVQEIRSGIQDAMAGGAALDPKMARYIVNAVKNRDAPNQDNSDLSERETEILLLIAEGKARKEISGKLQISVKTVDNHIAHIFEKLHVANAPRCHRQSLQDRHLSAQIGFSAKSQTLLTGSGE